MRFVGEIADHFEADHGFDLGVFERSGMDGAAHGVGAEKGHFLESVSDEIEAVF